MKYRTKTKTNLSQHLQHSIAKNPLYIVDAITYSHQYKVEIYL